MLDKTGPAAAIRGRRTISRNIPALWDVIR